MDRGAWQTTVPSVLAWKIPWAEEPGRLQSIGSQRVRHDWAYEHARVCVCKYICALIYLYTHTHTHTYNEGKSHSAVSDSLQPHRLYSPWYSPGQNTGVGSHSLFQKIFPTQGLNPGLPHCRQILYLLSHKGSPRILEWVAYPFSRGFSQPRNRTRVSCIAGGFFTNWAIRDLFI